MLVGTHIELRDDQEIVEDLTKKGQKPITPTMGEKLAKKLKAARYMECSVLTQQGLKDLFEEAVLTALKPPKPEKRKCVIL